jgi:ABC-type multidrug transport system ATPase subunit
VRARTEELDLGSVSQLQVKVLSGGMKRRLSVTSTKVLAY